MSTTIEKRPRGRFWKWSKRIALISVVLACVARVTLRLWLPGAVKVAAGELGLRCEYEGFDLSLLGMDVELRHVDVWDSAHEGADPLAHLEYARLDVDVSSLLLFDLRVHRIEVDGVDARLERDAEGQWLLPVFASGAAEPVEPVEPEDPDSTAKEVERWDLTVPVQVDAVRAQDVRLSLVDAVTGVDTRFDANLSVSDIGHATRPIRIELNATCLDLVDALTLEVEGRMLPRTAHFDVQLAARGVRPEPLGGLFEEFGFRPVARTLELGMGLQLEVDSAEDRRHLELRADMQDLGLVVDGVQRVRIASTSAAALVDPGRIEVEHVDLSDVGINVARSSEGLLRVAGFDLVPPRTSAKPEAPAPPKPKVDPGQPLEWGIGRVDFDAVQFALEDGFVEPASILGAHIETLSLRDVGPGRPTQFSMHGGLQPTGSAWSFDGAVTPGSDVMSMEAKIAVNGSDFSKLDPWLLPLGLMGVESAANLTLDLVAKLSDAGGVQNLEASLSGLALSGEESLLGLPSAMVHVEWGEAQVRVVEARVEGGYLAVTRAPDGSFACAGFQTTTSKPSPARAMPASSPAPAGSEASSVADTTEPSPLLVLEQLVVADTVLHLVDAGGAEPRAFDISMGGEVTDFVLNSDTVNESRFEWNTACDGVGKVQVGGRLTTRPGPLDLDLLADLSGEGLDLTPFAGFFEGSGLEPRLTDGHLAGRIAASVKQEQGSTRLALKLNDLAFRQADTEFLALDSLDIAELVLGPMGTKIGVIDVEGLRADVRRGAESALHVAGFAIPVAPAGSQAASGQPSASVPVAENAPAASEPQGTTWGGQGLACAGIRVGGVALRWRDEGRAVPVDTMLTGRMEVGAVAMGNETPIELDFGLSDAVEFLRMKGAVTVSTDAPRAAFDIHVGGLRGGWMDSYLPPGQAIDLRDGQLALRLEAQLDAHAEGGRAASFSLRDLELRDGATGPVLMGVSEVLLAAPRIDDEVVQITDVVARGIVASVQRQGETWLAAGLRMEASSADPASSDGVPVETGASAPTPAPVATGETEPGLPPRIDIERLAFEVDALTVMEGDAAPLELSFGLHNRKPLTVIGPVPEELPAWDLLLSASSPTALDRFEIEVELHPWVFEPLLKVSVEMSGLHGTAIHDSLPGLLGDLELHDISDGRAAMELTARMDLRRRVPTEFDLSRGFGLEVEVSNASYRASADGPVLAGVESIFLHAPRIGGESGAVHISELAVDGIVGAASNDSSGLHVLGLTIPPAVADGKTGDAKTGEAQASGASRAAAGAKVVEASAPTGEGEVPNARSMPPIRVDQIAVNGLDFQFQDSTFDPPLIVPLDELAVSVTGFRIGGEQAPSPVRFELALGAGKVELPKRVRSSSLIAGVLSAAASAATGGSDDAGVEPRSILDELVVSGSIVPSETPTGALEVNITGLELLALRGPALAGGVEISSGRFDGRVKMRLEEGGASRTKASLTMADLGLDEPPGGPISTYLKLPAPLQSVLFLLKDADDEIAVPFDLEVDAEGGVSGRKLAASAVSAFGSIVTDAVAASAFRVGGMVTGLLGFGGPKEIPDEATVLFEYGPGIVELPADAGQRMAVLLDVLKDDEMIVVLQPVLGLDDLERAEVLASPSGGDRLAMVAQLRQRKLTLWRNRDQGATSLDTVRRLGDQQAALGLVEELRGIDGDLGRTEQALDNVLALLRDGAERRGPRRARQLAMEFATERARQVSELLKKSGLKRIGERIEVRRARLPGSDEIRSGVLGLVPRRRAK